MFRVVTPSNAFYVTPEQLPRFLANLSETRYVSESGEFLQVTSQHELVTDSTTAILLVRQPLKATQQEREQYQKMWKEEKTKREALEAKLAREASRKKRK